MANIKMCNRDGKIFGTSEEGWSEWSGKIHGRYDDGTPRDVTDHFDFCPACTLIMSHVQPETVPDRKMISKADEAREKGYDPDYVAWLERETSKPIDEVDGEIIP